MSGRSALADRPLNWRRGDHTSLVLSVGITRYRDWVPISHGRTYSPIIPDFPKRAAPYLSCCKTAKYEGRLHRLYSNLLVSSGRLSRPTEVSPLQLSWSLWSTSRHRDTNMHTASRPRITLRPVPSPRTSTRSNHGASNAGISLPICTSVVDEQESPAPGYHVPAYGDRDRERRLSRGRTSLWRLTRGARRPSRGEPR